jgi:hypothetical protein
MANRYHILGNLPVPGPIILGVLRRPKHEACSARGAAVIGLKKKVGQGFAGWTKSSVSVSLLLTKQSDRGLRPVRII